MFFNCICKFSKSYLGCLCAQYSDECGIAQGLSRYHVLYPIPLKGYLHRVLDPKCCINGKGIYRSLAPIGKEISKLNTFGARYAGVDDCLSSTTVDGTKARTLSGRN